MSTLNQNAINAYTRMDVDMAAMVASPHKLVLMLFDAAIKSIAKARLAMQKKQVKVKCDAIDRAISIIQDGLQLSLDTKNGGPIAENLNALYEYMCIQLALANAQNDVAKLDEIGRMLLDFKKSWEQIETSAQQSGSVKAVEPVANVMSSSKPQDAATVIAKSTSKATSKPAAGAVQPTGSAVPKKTEKMPQAQSAKDETGTLHVMATQKILKGYTQVAEPEHSFKA